MVGPPRYRPIVDEVMADSPAMSAGMVAGDVILGINGREAESSRVVREEVYDSPHVRRENISKARKGRQVFGSPIGQQEKRVPVIH